MNVRGTMVKVMNTTGMTSMVKIALVIDETETTVAMIDIFPVAVIINDDVNTRPNSAATAIANGIEILFILLLRVPLS